MELSVLVAKIMAVIYISSGIGVLLGQVNFNTITADLMKSPALTFVAGSCGVIIGMVLVHSHNHWVNNWTVLITIISWVFLLGGLMVVVYPKSLSYLSKYYKHSWVWGIMMIGIGLFLGYFGFVK